MKKQIGYWDYARRVVDDLQPPEQVWRKVQNWLTDDLWAAVLVLLMVPINLLLIVLSCLLLLLSTNRPGKFVIEAVVVTWYRVIVLPISMFRTRNALKYSVKKPISDDTRRNLKHFFLNKEGKIPEQHLQVLRNQVIKHTGFDPEPTDEDREPYEGDGW